MTVAAPSQLAADAGAAMGSENGNAVDAATAAMLVAMITEPGVCSLGGGGYITVWGDQDPVTVDGYMEMPGRGLPPDAFGAGFNEITMAYGGGVTTQVGFGTVATPGGLKALASVTDQFGRVPWRHVLGPAIEAATRGFPLSQSSAHYLTFAHTPVFGLDPNGYAALDNNGETKVQGDIVVVPELADALNAIADEGVRLFYEGEMAEGLAAAMAEGGGIVTRSDLAAYRESYRRPIDVSYGEWTVATNPAPAIGGATLAAMLELLKNGDTSYIDVQRAVLGYRRDQLDDAAERSVAVAVLLDLARGSKWRSLLTSPSTVHVSAVDRDGLGCSITMSAGYGAGVMVPGTGIWLNNSLGEIELNRQGFHAIPVGERLISNMAPSVARNHTGSTVAIGSPGADRITTAMASTLVHLANGEPLEVAIEAPRSHVEFTDSGPRVAAEPGAELGDCDIPVRWFEGLDMYFGGVAAAMVHADHQMEAAADPRRTGGTASG